MLEAKLERRIRIVEKEQAEEDRANAEIEFRHDIHEQTLEDLVSKGRLLERTKAEILDEYEKDLRNIKFIQKESLVYLFQMLNNNIESFLDYRENRVGLQDRLNRRKEERLKKLQDEQERRKQEFLRKCENSSDIQKITTVRLFTTLQM